MNQIIELEKQIISHKESYYLGSPTIPDHLYDELEDELRTLSPDSYVLNMVGSTPGLNLPKIKHDKKMLSLEKTYELKELISWIKGEEVVSTIKLDGISCSLVYNNGELSVAKTRGNGSLGEDITEKVKWIKSIPKKIGIKGKVEVRGEILCLFKDFDKLKIKMKSIGLEEPSSPRNISAGLISRKDHLFLCSLLTFKSFDLIFYNDLFLKEEVQKIKILKDEGFLLAEYDIHHTSLSIQKTIDRASELMNQGEYQLDGIVFTYNKIEKHEELGETAHHPRYKIAYKFRGESKVAKIEKIFWDISRNGIYTPVAIIEPTELSGAMISRVTLHNYGVVRDHKIKIGDEIRLIRSGEVIPKFLGVEKEAEGSLSFPRCCKYCNEKLTIDDIRIICRNESCVGKIKGQILNFIQKIGIDDLSEKRLDQLMENKLVSKIEDLYTLDVDKLIGLEKVKEKLASKLINSILNSKKVDLVTFMSSLGLTGGALNKNEKIINSGFNSIEKIINLSVDELVEVDGFAKKSASDYLISLEKKKDLINNLVSLGFVFSRVKEVDNKDSLVFGKRICITGTLSRKRSDIEKEIKRNGGEAVKSVSTKTDVLVCNDSSSSSSKMNKAKELGVKIISEEDLFRLF